MLTTLAAAVEETRSAVSSVTGQIRIAITDTDTVSEYLLLKVIAVKNLPDPLFIEIHSLRPMVAGFAMVTVPSLWQSYDL